MSVLTTNVTTTNAATGLPVPAGLVMTTLTGTFMATCPTGEPPGGLNTFPGTDPNAPGNSDPGLPYGFQSVPSTGPLG